jgi:PAS domain S-box-containing protein
MTRLEGSKKALTLAIRYGSAAVAVLASLGAYVATRAWLGPGLPDFITFYPAVMIVSLLAGLGPGLLATLLADALTAYWIMPPTGSLYVAAAVDRFALLLFAGLGIFVSLVAHYYRQHRRQAAAYEQERAFREAMRASEEGLRRLNDELKVANASLFESRETAVKLMDDAFTARRRAEEAINELRSEMAERKHAQDLLRLSEERLRFALETSRTGAWDLNLVEHTAYRSLEHDRIFGYSELLPQWTYEMFLDHVIPEDREAVDAKFRHATSTRSDWNFECRIRRADGEVRWIWAAGRHRVGEEGGPRSMTGIVQDITERNRVEESLRESEERLRLLGDNLPDSAVYQYTHEHNGRKCFLYFSAGVERLNGVTVQEVLQDASKLHSQIPAQYLVSLLAEEKRSAGDMTDFDMEVPMRKPDGQLRWMRLHSRPRRLPDGRVLWDGVQTDITTQKEVEERLRQSAIELKAVNSSLVESRSAAINLMEDSVAARQQLEQTAGELRQEIEERTRNEEELRRYNRILHALSKSGEALIRASEEQTYLKEVCRIIVEDCHHAMVWVGIAEDDPDKTVRPIAHAGFEEGYLETLKITWSDTERGRGPTGTAIRTGRPCGCANMLTDPRFEPWRAEAIRRGYASSIVLPLLSAQKTLGALTIYSREPDAFTQAEVEMLTNLADDLAYGITLLHLRAAHTQVEAALRKSEDRYHSLFTYMSEGFALHEIITDEQGTPSDYRFLDLNPAFEQLTGLTRGRVLNRCVREIMPGTEDFWIENYGRVALTGKSIHFENYSAVLNRWYAVLAYRPAPRQFAVVFTDITERKKAELAVVDARNKIENERNRLLAIMQALPIGVALLDEHGGNVGSNPAFEATWGGTRPATNSIADYAQYQAWWADTGSPLQPQEWASARAISLGETVIGQELEIQRFDGNRAFVLNCAAPIRNAEGTIVGCAVAVLDITDLKLAEARLKASLREKEVLLKEIHHRVKNNLQIITSLVNLQADSLDNPKLSGLFQDIRDRVRSMALVHEKLYQSENLEKVDFAEYTRNLLLYLWRGHSNASKNIQLNLDLQPVAMSMDVAVPCGLMLNELATNSLKHAFAGRIEGEVNVSLSPEPDGKVCMRVSDQGIGLPAGFDWRQSHSLGLQLVQMLAGQLCATVEVKSGAGTEFVISFAPFGKTSK